MNQSDSPEPVDATSKNDAVTLFLLAVLGAFVVAVVFVVAHQYSLPPTDGAFGQAPFQDPLVVPVMLVGVMVGAIAAFPFALWLLRRVDLWRSFVVVLLSTLVGVLLVTPSLGFLGVPAGFLAMVGGMLFCRHRRTLSE